MSSLTIIVPTIGRKSLETTLRSIEQAGFMCSSDQLILVADGMRAASRARTLSDNCCLSGNFVVIDDGPHRDWGHTPRNRVMAKAVGDYILSIDDDDVYLPLALDMVQRALGDTELERSQKLPHVFRMKWRGNQVLWTDKEIRQCNVSTQMICVPNKPGYLGVWGSRYQGDLDFLQSTAALYAPDEIIWREEVIVKYGG